MRMSSVRRRSRWSMVAVSGVVLTSASIAAGPVVGGPIVGGPTAGAATATATADPFDAPSGLTFTSGHVWVANEANSSVTEVLPVAADGGSPGKVTRTVRGDGLARPDAIVSDTDHVWVANLTGSPAATGSVTELTSGTGALVRQITGTQYRLDQPDAIKLDGTTLLVLNNGDPTAHPAVAGSITEINATTGALIRTISGSDLKFVDPVALAVSGSDAWVADKSVDTVTEIDVSTGTLVRTIVDHGLAGPDGLATGGGSVWVADDPTSALTQINDTTGAVTATWTDGHASYGFHNPTVVMAYGGSAYVATPDGVSPMVTNVPEKSPGAPSWYMCNTNGPYYFSELSGFAASSGDLWVASRSGANWQGADPAKAATGTLTELNAGSGALVGTMP